MTFERQFALIDGAIISVSVTGPDGENDQPIQIECKGLKLSLTGNEALALSQVLKGAVASIRPTGRDA